MKPNSQKSKKPTKSVTPKKSLNNINNSKSTTYIIVLLIFVFSSLLFLGNWQIKRGLAKQAILDKFDKENQQSIKHMSDYNDFNNLDKAPEIFTRIRIQGMYSNLPQDLVWLERFQGFKSTEDAQESLIQNNNKNNIKNKDNINNLGQNDKGARYLLLQKLYIDQNPSNIRYLWVWRGISATILSSTELKNISQKVDKTMRVIPRVPSILTLGQNCYNFNPDFKTKTDDLLNQPANNIVKICQNFVPNHGGSESQPQFIMLDELPSQPLTGIEDVEVLKAHFVKVSPQRHFAYAATWLGLCLVLMILCAYYYFKNLRKK